MNNTATADRRIYYSLDAMRGVAAISVLMWHTAVIQSPYLYFPGSYLAVDLFFVLSGFVLSHAYERRFANGMTVLEFMRARYIRLYPLYIVALSITVTGIVAAWVFHVHTATPWTVRSIFIVGAFNLLFLPAPPITTVDTQFPLDVPAWSLFYEVFINYLFVLCWRWLSVRVLTWVCILSAAALLFACLFNGSASMGSQLKAFPGGAVRVFFSFPLGILIYRYHTRLTLPRVNPWILLVAFVLAIWVPAEGLYRALYDWGVIVAVFPVLVLFGGLAEVSPKNLPIFSFLGTTSYAIYVLHAPTWMITVAISTKLFHSGLADLAPWLGLALLALVLAMSWILDEYYDKPVRAWLTEQFRKRSAAAA